MIGDSFWFIVTFFKYNTNLKSGDNYDFQHKLQSAVVENEDILKRISLDYFQFFIKICEENINKDPIQKSFYDFIAQCVFYSIYLAFPKSRHIFTSEFKNTILSIFAYLYNGLTLEKYNIDHWDLDLGTGNVIEDEDFYKNKEFKKDGKYSQLNLIYLTI